MRTRWFIGLAALTLILVTVSAQAQSVSGALEGTVLSMSGEPLDGVLVVASGPSLQGQRTATTDRGGRFLLTGLPPGAYSVELRRIGLRPQRFEQVTVLLGTTSSLELVRLEVQAIEIPEVVINDRRPVIDPLSGAASTVISSSMFLQIPTDRNLWSVSLLAPQSAPSSFGFDMGPNIGGASECENAFFTDGVNVTDINDGRGSMVLPYNFVKEVQVLSGGYDAEYGQAQGGLMNAITYSGGNTLHGELSGFYTGDRLRSHPRWAIGQERVEDYDNYDFGLGLGGPIRKDRLWYFAAYNPSFETRSSKLPGLPPEDDTTVCHLLATKLTWHASPQDDIVLTALGDPTVRNGIALGSFQENVANIAEFRQTRKTGMRSLTLRAGHHAKAYSLAATLSRTAEEMTDYPHSGIPSDALEITRVEDYTTRTSSGGVGGFSVNDLYRTSARISGIVFSGAHAVKAGVEYQQLSQKMVYDVSWLMITGDPGAPYVWYRNPLKGEVYNRVPTAYVQDSWHIGRHFRINPGLRWEAQFMGGQNGPTRSIKDQWAPRLGLIVEPGNQATQKIALSLGRYYEVIPTWSVAVWNGEGELVITSYPRDPRVDPTDGTELTNIPWGNTPGEPHLRGQYYDDASLSYERQLASNMKAGVRLVGRTLRNAVEDGRIPSIGVFTMGNPGRGILAELPRPRREYRALEFTIERPPSDDRVTLLASYLLSRNRGNYTGLFAQDIWMMGFGANASPQYDGADLLASK